MEDVRLTRSSSSIQSIHFTCMCLEKRAKGQILFSKICEHLNLLEKDYFGITYKDTDNQKNWLDPSKELKKQIRNGPWNFAFNVKFYPPDPSQLSEDITRYYLCLQLRDDVVSGRLPCSFATHTVLGSYTVQSELGDYDPEEMASDYVSELRLAPNQTKELEEKVMELHKNYKGMTPAEAEMHFLENAKKLSMYGVDLHHAKDSEGVEIMLGVCASGLLIYRDKLRINRFAWPKILKISYKRNNFYIKIRPGEFEQFESTIGFKLPNHRAAKRLWKVCVEHHTFFRLVSPEAPQKKFLSLGSKFRYSGRTQAQTRRASSQIIRPAPFFERTSSKRYNMSRSLDGATIAENHDTLMKDSTAGGDTKAAAIITTVTTEREEKTEQEDRPLHAYTADPLRSELSLPSSPVLSTKVRRRRRESAHKRASSVSPAKGGIGCRRRQARADRKAALLEEQELLLSARKQRLEQGKGRSGTLFSFSLHLPHLSSILDDDGYITFPDLSEMSFLPHCAQNFLPIKSPSLIPCFLFIFFFLLSTSFSVPYALTLSFPLALCLCYLEPKAASLTASIAQGYHDHDSSEEEETDSERTDFAFDGDITVTEDTEPLPEVAKHQTNISELKRSFLETAGSSTPGPTEWEKRLSSSPLRSPRSDEAPMIEPLEPQDVSGRRRHDGMVVRHDVTKETGGKQWEQCWTGLQGGLEEQMRMSGSCQLQVSPGTSGLLLVAVLHRLKDVAAVVCHRCLLCTKSSSAFITFSWLFLRQADTNGDADPGVLLSAQTITSETTSTTTTTHITKTVKGGISETRIEKRIVITGDADIDHDEALAQAIKEAKEQHPDMSVTKVVVHKETEITPEGED
uniref:Erythrocyte membrane protein band 4.1 like 3 n=1 Tax=Oryzias sinensis TaxID=183150 RepID=A0A8C8DZV5_9TELE